MPRHRADPDDVGLDLLDRVLPDQTIVKEPDTGASVVRMRTELLRPPAFAEGTVPTFRARTTSADFPVAYRFISGLTHVDRDDDTIRFITGQEARR
jgi:hypothetical protein